MPLPVKHDVMADPIDVGELGPVREMVESNHLATLIQQTSTRIRLETIQSTTNPASFGGRPAFSSRFHLKATGDLRLRFS